MNRSPEDQFAPPVAGAGLRGLSGHGPLLLALGLVYVVWGSVFLAIHCVVLEAPPFGSMGLRFLLAGALMGLLLMRRFGPRRLRITRRQTCSTAVMGLALLAVSNGAVSLAQLHGLATGVIALLVASVPAWNPLYRALNGDRPSALTLLGIGLGLAGLTVLILLGGEPGAVSLPVFPVGLVLLASMVLAFGAWVQPRLDLPGDLFVSAAYQLLAAGLALLVLSALRGEELDLDYSARAWLAVSYLAVIGSMVGFTAYAWLLANAPVSLVATHAYVNPVVAVLLGWSFLSEPITAAILLGGGIVLASVVLVVRGEHAGTVDRQAHATVVALAEYAAPCPVISSRSRGET